jgi:hypothetical protein
MRSRFLTACVAVLAFSAPGWGQTPSTVTLTANNLKLGDGATPLPVGDQVCVLTTDINDNPFSYRIGSSSGLTSASGSQAVCPTLTVAGVLPSGVSVINSAASAPGPACIRITEVDPVNGEILRMTCVQTGTPSALASWCSITSGVETCDLDFYQPAVPATPVAQPSTTSGALNVAGALGVTGTATFGGAITFASGQTFPGYAPLAAGTNAFTGNMTVAGNINTAATPGTVFAANRFAQITTVNTSTATLATTDCGDAKQFIYTGGTTLTLPTLTTFSAMPSCIVHLTPSVPVTLSSGSANIYGLAIPGSPVATFTIPAGSEADITAYQGFGYGLSSMTGPLTYFANTWTAAQTFAAGATLGSALSVPPMESVVTGGINLAGPVAGGAPTLPVFPGGTFIGDSATGGYSPGCTPVPVYGWCTTGYAWLLAPDLGGFPTVQGAAGDTSVDMLREWLLPYIAANPVQDQRMPLKLGTSGGNDAIACSGCTTRYVSSMMTAFVLSAVPASHVTFGQSAGVTPSGTWAADNFASLGTYDSVGPQPAVSGMAEVSSAASSTLSFPITTTVNNQGVYCGRRVFTTAVSGGYSSGAASFAIAGTSITDTWSALLGTGTGHNTNDSVFTVQYIVPVAGTYTATVTVTTAPFSFVYCAVAPQTLYEVGQPAAVFANVAHQLPAYGGTADSTTGAYTTAFNALVAQLQGDNLAVGVADVWDYVLPGDINHVDGIHPTIAGYQHVRDAFEYAILQLSQRGMGNAALLRSCGTFTTTSTSQTFSCAQVTPQSKCATAARNSTGASVYISAQAAGSITVASTIGANFDLSCSSN